MPGVFPRQDGARGGKPDDAAILLGEDEAKVAGVAAQHPFPHPDPPGFGGVVPELRRNERFVRLDPAQLVHATELSSVFESRFTQDYGHGNRRYRVLTRTGSVLSGRIEYSRMYPKTGPGSNQAAAHPNISVLDY
ncbi:hypothetical protein GCM10008097_16980 [Mycetocola manganoxydans]|nr:hypothetical protein GCM10008097_16980 [Mycetocola manganoxydans]